MWEWFTSNSTWIMLVSAFLLVALLVMRDRASKKTSEKDSKLKKPSTYLTVVFWIIEAILLALVAASLWAIIVSREGIGTLITPEMVTGWLKEHGSAILFILLLGLALWYGLTRFLPPLLTRLMVHPVRGESLEGIKKRTATLRNVFMSIGKITIIIIILFMILDEMKIPIAPILAGFGIAGIAVGFGAQYLIKDLIAGVFVLMENQYRVGDVVKIADVSGLVEEINLRKTVLRDLDGIVHHVPNGEIRVASNFTRHFSRVNLNISVSYNTDLDHAINVINRVCREMSAEDKWSKVIRTVPQVLRVDKFGDSGIELKITGDVKPIEQWNVMGEMRLRLKKAFEAESIEIPWPHMKVYFGNSPDDVRKTGQKDG
ncbi:MAG: mechanosensitive ion channel family protein [Dehalococcoidales bacterium]|nr:mechanosensitive ion channel family protein [Dehalococcoidales bacterium]